MSDTEDKFLIYAEDVQKIKALILQSRYQSAYKANVELLNLYYNVGRYISLNTRSGKWGTNAINSISQQLQGELEKLHGFSPSNMKNMRTFFES